MPKFHRSQDEVLAELADQIEAFRASCNAYDNGIDWEIKRVAASIYLLCHDGTGRTQALLTQANVRPKLRFPSYVKSAIETDGHFYNGLLSPLVLIRVTGDWPDRIARFEAILDTADTYEQIQFPKWWSDQVIHMSAGKGEKKRRNIIFILANQDGGRHFDRAITDEEYWVMKTEGDPNFCYEVGLDNDEKSVMIYGPAIHLRTGAKTSRPRTSGQKPILNAPSAITRQIAWELDQALQNLGH